MECAVRKGRKTLPGAPPIVIGGAPGSLSKDLFLDRLCKFFKQGKRLFEKLDDGT